jgi:hypothetical protein
MCHYFLVLLLADSVFGLCAVSGPAASLLRADSPDTTSPLNLSLREQQAATRRSRLNTEHEDEEEDEDDEDEEEEEEEEEGGEGGARSSQSTPSPAATALCWPPPSLWSSPSLVEPARRIWSPAIACEQETSQKKLAAARRRHNNNNNNYNRKSGSAAAAAAATSPTGSGGGSGGNSSSVVVKVEVVCGDCGGAATNYRPDVTARCQVCSLGQGRSDRAFPVSTRTSHVYNTLHLKGTVS